MEGEGHAAVRPGTSGWTYIRFTGLHATYDRIDAAIVLAPNKRNLIMKEIRPIRGAYDFKLALAEIDGLPETGP